MSDITAKKDEKLNIQDICTIPIGKCDNYETIHVNSLHVRTVYLDYISQKVIRTKSLKESVKINAQFGKIGLVKNQVLQAY
ncbi:MAG: hypothetical protein Sylvanvirus30_7 [Sylvanvirus sp.]|uniref:Uncharacterized protein n=1 Tax=Sylvanvirus sp. TaxID=2487774 RepID=A0A3G5AIY7_9VIRU|nr:MAG: hypothetical protein Sylvanvirus30_7 [Sylvanvirus sp.]